MPPATITKGRRHRRAIGFLLLSAVAAAPAAVHAAPIPTGFDVVHPTAFTTADQDAALAHLKTAGVRIIRFGMEDMEAENIDFMARATAQGIRTFLIFHGKYAPGAPVRPYRPKEYPGMWEGPPISALDADRSRAYFQQVMDQLDARGIVLAGMELENEINMANNNPDFSLPGEGRVLGLGDLSHDPEGRQVAKGYLQYLKVLAVLKQVRDQSRRNRQTPLLPTSLVDTGPEGPWPTAKSYDGVSAGATLAFFRANGLDRLVDAYNIHTYPWADGPGEKASAIHRLRRLEQLMRPLCSPAGTTSGKPCWVTEWGFMNNSRACPSDETARIKLVPEMIDDFRQLAGEHRLAGLIYYSWIGEARFDVYRCGGLTKTGQLAMSPP